MNIQISVIIWTIICFCLLCVILKNLLFTPILKVIDERNQKISDAKAKKLKDTLELDRTIAQNQQKLADMKQAVQSAAEELVASQQHLAEEIIEKKKTEEQKKNDICKVETHAQMPALSAELDSEASRLAEIFITGVVS